MCACYQGCPECPSEVVCREDEAREGAVSVLEEAAAITSGARRNAYGHPSVNHGRTSQLVAAYLEVRPDGPINTTDVVWINVLQKISRDLHSPKRDNLVDVCGFVQNLAEIRGY